MNMAAKYNELKNALLRDGRDIQNYTFEDIADIIGEPISPVYIVRKTFKHSASSFQRNANEVGFTLVDVDYTGGELTFQRTSTIVPAHAIPVITYNADLPASVTKDARGAVEITKTNWLRINPAIYSSPAYRYVSLFAPDEFMGTRPTTPADITLGQIITRLVIINQIDSVSLSKDIGSFEMLARSIQAEGIEDEISKGAPISNEKFRRITRRASVIPGRNGKNYFSAITKYISRSAQFIYDIKKGYPIFDGVLQEHLSLYIPTMDAETLKNDCDYEGYCAAINNYLETLNATLNENDQIDNIMFDQIVWYSYKSTSKSPKYR